jgi:MerR family transcriptional regulator, light-induced transcriptional regulator
MEHYSIRDLEKLSGIKAHTIRVWERRYGILPQHRTETNRRRYGDDELRRIINIAILHRNGFKISKIANFSGAEVEDKVSFLSKDTNRSDTQVDSVIMSMMDHNEKAVDKLLIRSILNRGIEDTFTDIVFPVLKRIGVMWHTGSADIGSEHFITNIFRQRIISSIDSLSPVFKQGAKKVILFLPDNELHELPLLFFNYIIRKMGHETIYFGQSTPLLSVVNINNQWNADIIITDLMSEFPNINPSDFVSQLVKSFPRQKILVAGVLAEVSVKTKFKNVFPIRSQEELKAHLE